MLGTMLATMSVFAGWAMAPAAPAVSTWTGTMGGVAPALALLAAAAAGALLLATWLEAIAPPRPGKTLIRESSPPSAELRNAA